ncbi:MAG: hypothetical protein AAB780_00200, partial [Patescibacteria group bacterium]
KTLFLALLFAVTMDHVQNEPSAPELLTYRLEPLNFEFKAPTTWKAAQLGEDGVMLSPGLEKWEEALPPPNHPWFMVLKPDEGVCSLDDRGRPVFGFAEGKAEAKICRAGMFVLFGYWERDREQREHVREMLEILESFRRLR